MRNLPLIHNSRSPQQWDIISKHVDFTDKTVLDLGCGYGDILFRCWRSGGKYCEGIDSGYDIAMIKRLTDLCISNPGFYFYQAPIEEYITSYMDEMSWDITICFSVLPYLEKPFTVLRWMQQHSKISLIEVQLNGDGPGSNPWFRNPEESFVSYVAYDDSDMREILKMAGWQSIEAIGHTMVKENRYKRTIWMCQ